MNSDALALRKDGALAVRKEDDLLPREAEALAVGDTPQKVDLRERDLQSQERFEDELIMHLERDQFVAETSRPVPRATLSTSVTAGLWALRIFVIVVSLMVLYTFIDQLH